MMSAFINFLRNKILMPGDAIIAEGQPGANLSLDDYVAAQGVKVKLQGFISAKEYN